MGPACRACGAATPADAASLFGAADDSKPSYATLLAECSGVAPVDGDGLPDRICDGCVARLRDALAFVRDCRDVDRGTKRRASPHECETCGKRFSRASDLVAHSRTHSGERPFACDACDRAFAQRGTLVEHRRKHTGETPFSCATCGRAFASRSSFWRHRRVHTGERPHSCAVCGDAFALRSTLAQHASVHADERPHACRECGKTSKSVGALRRHAARHATKRFVCERCGGAFATSASLAAHAKRAHEEAGATSERAVHSCDACGRSFAHKSALAFHLTMHRNVDKHKCDAEQCGKTFPKRNMLEFHVRKHHSHEKPYACARCSSRYYRASALTRHSNTAHRNVNESKITQHES